MSPGSGARNEFTVESHCTSLSDALPLRRVSRTTPRSYPVRTRSKIFTFAAALVGLLLLPGAALAVTSEDITEEEFRTRYAPEDEDLSLIHI